MKLSFVCRPGPIPAANTATLRAMSTWVTMGRVVSWPGRTIFWAPDFVHSGQWKPTDAWRMQSGQMGRSQRWQTTPARRSVCR